MSHMTKYAIIQRNDEGETLSARVYSNWNQAANCWRQIPDEHKPLALFRPAMTREEFAGAHTDYANHETGTHLFLHPETGGTCSGPVYFLGERHEDETIPDITKLPVRACSIECIEHPEWGTWGISEDKGLWYEIRGDRGSRILFKDEAARFWRIVS